MAYRQWERWAPIAGVLAVVCFAVALIVYGGSPDSGATDQKITSYFADSSHQKQVIVGFFFLFAALLLLLVFLTGLRGRLVAAEGEGGRLSALAFGGGVASAVLLMAANATGAAPAIAVNDTGRFALDPNTYRLFNDLSYLLIISGVMTAIALVATTSYLALRTGAVFPRWFAWVGYYVALTFVVAVFFIPLLILWLWILIASLLMLLWRPSGAGATDAAPSPGTV